MEDPANIIDQPEYQKWYIRHHSRIADALFSFLLELLDVFFGCFSFFMQDFFYRTHRKPPILNVFFVILRQIQKRRGTT